MMVSLSLLRWNALATVAATAVMAVAGIGGLRLNSHYSVYFDPDDPLLLAHQEISDLYSRDDAIFIALQSTQSFLEPENYRLLEDLTERLARQPFTTSVLSITELGIIGETVTEEGDNIPSLQQLRENGHALGLLLAEGLDLAGIWVQIDLPDKNSRTVVDTVGAVRQSVDSAVRDLPVSAHYTGTLALNEAYINVVRHDLRRIVPLLLLVMVIVLGWLLRRRLAVFTLLPVAICSVVAAFGVVGLFEAELAAINTFAPIIIFSISIAGCVHMALSYDHYRDKGMAADDAALAAARYNLVPMLLANGTTALGFLGLTLSPSPPIRVIGYLVASGIVVSFVLCLTLLPVLQARFDPWRPAKQTRILFLDRLALFVSRRRTSLVVVFLCLSLPAAWLASRNVISDNVLEYFVSSHAFHRDTQLVADQLSGVNEVLYSLQAGDERGYFDADAVEALDRLTVWLGRQPEVNRAISIADAGALREARQDGRLQQRLDFYRDRVGNADDRNPLLDLAVSNDYSSSVVTAYLQQLDSARLISFDDRVHAWAAENMRGYTLTSGGATLMFANLGEQNIRSMLASLTIALFVAALIFGAAFRSLRLAWAGLVCNFLPVLLVYSVWAVVYGQISIGAAVVMGMILGIVLDDTIYFLATYRRGLQAQVDDPIGYAMRRVGPALIATTVTLTAGLSMGLLSEFGPIWNMSVLSISIIGAALAVDLLLLPALLPATRSHGGAA